MSNDIWRTFPQLVAGVLLVESIPSDASTDAPVAELSAVAASRLQYRSASESLLRRYLKQGSLPHLHPLVEVCNAASLAFAIPVAAFDVARITGDLEVRHAVGNESYQSFPGDSEHPTPVR
jgi:DNA/RNA-binding domain of Phe-tRNA-synthetase-like protein